MLASRVDEHYFELMGLDDPSRPRLRGGGLGRRAEGRDRQRAVRASLLAEPGPDRQAVAPRPRRRVGAGRGAREDEQVSLHRRAADRVRLLPVPAAARRRDGHARPVGRRSREPRRPAPRDGPPPGSDLPIYNVRTMEEFYRMRATHHLQRAHRDRCVDGPDGPRPRHRRPLRAGGVRGQPPDPGDRDPHGDWRRPEGGAPHGPRSRPRAGGGRPGGWARGQRRGGTVAGGGVSDGRATSRISARC